MGFFDCEEDVNAVFIELNNEQRSTKVFLADEVTVWEGHTTIREEIFTFLFYRDIAMVIIVRSK